MKVPSHVRVKRNELSLSQSTWAAPSLIRRKSVLSARKYPATVAADANRKNSSAAQTMNFKSLPVLAE